MVVHFCPPPFPRYPKNTQLLLGAALAITRMNDSDKARDYFRRAVEVRQLGWLALAAALPSC